MSSSDIGNHTIMNKILAHDSIDMISLNKNVDIWNVIANRFLQISQVY